MLLHYGLGPYLFKSFFRSVQISVIRVISGEVFPGFPWFSLVFPSCPLWLKALLFPIETKWPTVAHFIAANQLRNWPIRRLESGHLDKTAPRNHCTFAALDRPRSQMAACGGKRVAATQLKFMKSADQSLSAPFS
jgi:hypothetical protein